MMEERNVIVRKKGDIGAREEGRKNLVHGDMILTKNIKPIL